MDNWKFDLRIFRGKMVGAGIGGEEQRGGVGYFSIFLILDGGKGNLPYIRSGVYKGLNYHIEI